MISYIYKNCFAVLKKKPVRLWGLSMLVSLLTVIAVLATWTLPILFVPIVLTLNAGMALVYLDGYRGKEVNSEQIFAGFKKFAHVAGGMAWMSLWIFIWALIPLAGIVFAVIKAYSYRFTPYILMTQPEVSATEALRLSMKKTNGYKGTMFGADMIIFGICVGVQIVLLILAFIPLIGILFAVISFLFTVFVSIAVPLLSGLINAAFYDEISKLPPKQAFNPGQAQQAGQTAQTNADQANAGQANAASFCPNCGNAVSDGAAFCGKCGCKLK